MVSNAIRARLRRARQLARRPDARAPSPRPARTWPATGVRQTAGTDRPDPADLTIWGRLRSTPGVAVYVLLAAAAIALAVVCAIHARRFIAAPDVGFDET